MEETPFENHSFFKNEILRFSNVIFDVVLSLGFEKKNQLFNSEVKPERISLVRKAL